MCRIRKELWRVQFKLAYLHSRKFFEILLLIFRRKICVGQSHFTKFSLLENFSEWKWAMTDLCQNISEFLSTVINCPRYSASSPVNFTYNDKLSRLHTGYFSMTHYKKSPLKWSRTKILFSIKLVNLPINLSIINQYFETLCISLPPFLTQNFLHWRFRMYQGFSARIICTYLATLPGFSITIK
jgi:hypothetical protein